MALFRYPNNVQGKDELKSDINVPGTERIYTDCSDHCINCYH